MDDREVKISDKRARSQRGSVFTVLLAGIAIAGALSVVLYQTISGPMSSMVRVQSKTSAKAQMQSIANIIIAYTTTQPNGGACDLTYSGGANPYVVPPQWTTAIAALGHGGQIPATVGAPTTDPWGTPYGYCVWEVGPSPSQGLCNGTAPNLLHGSTAPTAGIPGSQIVIAIISAGPDRKFQSSCAAYTNGTTNVVTQLGDDLVLKYTYEEAAVATSSIWSLSSSATTPTAVYGSNVSVGTAPTTVPTPLSSYTNGIVNANGVVSQGAIIAGGAVQLADNTTTTATPATASPVTDTTCTGNTLDFGALRYDTTSNNVDVCSCTGGWNTSTPPGCISEGWVAVGSSSSSSKLSSLTAGVATNTIDSTLYSQTWNWSTLGGASALTLGSTSTAAAGNAQTVLNVALSGANATGTQTTYGEQISNTHSGTASTDIGIYATATGGTTNYPAFFSGNSATSVETLRLDNVNTNGGSSQFIGFHHNAGELQTAILSTLPGGGGGQLDFETSPDTVTAPASWLRISPAGVTTFAGAAVFNGTAQFNSYVINGTNFYDSSWADPLGGTSAVIKASAHAAAGNPAGGLAVGLSGAEGAGMNTYAGYFNNGTTVSAGGYNYGLYVTGGNYNYFSGNLGIGTTTPTSTLQVAGSFANAIGTKTSAYTLTATDDVINASGTTTITLPSATVGPITGRQYTIKNVDTTGHVVTIATTSSQTIDGAATATLTAQNQSLTVITDGANWYSIASNGASGSSALSSLTAGVATNSINSANYSQTWNWNSLAGASALTLGSTSTAGTGTTPANSQTLLNIALSGTNGTSGQTTYGEQISNTHAGAGTNTGLYVTASGGTNNYAAIFNNGYVGIGTATPGARLDISDSLTGSSAVSTLNIAPTWNTTGSPTALKLNVLDTAAGASALLSDFQVGGNSRFSVDVNGDLAMGISGSNGEQISIDGGVMVIANNPNQRYIKATNGLQIQDATGNNFMQVANNSASIGSTGSIIFQADSSVVSNASATLSSAVTAPSSTTLTFNNLRGDGNKSAIINTNDLTTTGMTPVNLYMYPGRNSTDLTQGNIILATDGTIQRGNVGIGLGAATPTSTLQVAGSFANAIGTKTSAYTLTATDDVINASGTTTITLPSATVGPITGRQYTIKNVDTTGHVVTIATTSSQTIDGAATVTLTSQNQSLTVITDGANWYSIASNGASGSTSIGALTDAYTDYTHNNLLMGTSPLTKPALQGAGATNSTYVGVDAGNPTVTNTAADNTAVGYLSLVHGTSGSYNTAVGYQTMEATTTAGGNVAMGYNAMTSNVAGADNVGVGYNSLASGTGEAYTTAVGYNSMFNGEYGESVALGAYALSGSVTPGNNNGAYNNAIGYAALESDTSGSYNDAHGSWALLSNNTGTGNVAMGYQSLYTNANGSTNNAIGYMALYSNSSGNSNIAIGAEALYSNVTANYSSAMGHAALFSATGGSNTALGYQAGYGPSGTNALTTGSNDTLLGYNAVTQTSGISGSTAATVSNEMVFGNSSVTLQVMAGTGALVLPVGTSASTAVTSAGNAYCATATQGGLRYQTDGTAGVYYCNGSAWTALGGGGSIGQLTDALTNYTSGTYNMVLGGTLSGAKPQLNASAAYSTYVGLNAGNIGGTTNSGTDNASLGYETLFSNTTGSENTVMGYQAAYTNTGLGGNTAIGYEAMQYANSAATGTNSCCGTPNISGNTAIGIYALQGSATAANNTGVNNVALGYNTLTSTTSGSQNVAVGGGALYYSTVGSSNVAVGYQTLLGNGGMSGSTAVGYMAMLNANSAASGTTFNTAIGYESLYGSATASANTGKHNSVVGYMAMYNNTTGDSDDAVGYDALYTNTTGVDNEAMGYRALYSNSTGNYSQAIGFEALYSTTAGNDVGIGYQAAFSNTGGYNNIAIGSDALYSLTGVLSNTVAIGGQALYSATTGGNGTAIGYMALYSATNSTYNTAFGYEAGYNGGTNALTTQTDDTFLGANTQVSGAWSNSTAIGYNAIISANNQLQLGIVGASTVGTAQYVTFPNSTVVPTVCTQGSIYYNTAAAAFEFCQGSSLGWTTTSGAINSLSDALADYTNDNLILGSTTAGTTKPQIGTGTDNTFVGLYAGNIGGTTNTASDNVSLGYQTMYKVTSGGNNAGVGYQALYSNSTGADDVAVGSGALYSNTSNYNVGVGYQALYNNTIGNSNTAIGQSALFSNVAMANSTAMGFQAMYYANNTATAGSSGNSAFGYEALIGSTTASANTGVNNNAFGMDTLYKNSSGSYNDAMGFLPLFSNTTGTGNDAMGFSALYTNTSGSDNEAMGYLALYSNTTANYSSAMGFGALYSATGGSNTALGYEAGYAGSTPITTGSNDTFIGYQAQSSSASITDATAIGSNAVVAASHTIQLGASTVTAVNIPGTSTSGVTLNLGTTSSGSNILALGPVTGAAAPVSSGSNPALSNLTAAVATNTIDSAANAQVWNWSTLSSQTALTLETNGTSLTSGTLLNVAASGASTLSAGEALVSFSSAATNNAATSSVLSVTSATTGSAYGINTLMSGNNTGDAGYFVNNSTSALSKGIYASASAGVGGYFSSSSGYGLIVNSGSVGIGNTAPGALLDVGNATSLLGTLRLEGSTSGYTQIQPSAAAGSWTLTLPAAAPTTVGQTLTATNTSGATAWTTPGHGQVGVSPTAPSSTSAFTMQGLGGSITPTKSGTVLVIVSGVVNICHICEDGIQYQIHYGTGTAPSNGAAMTGTAIGQIQSEQGIEGTQSADTIPFSTSALITGLTVGTTYWVDLAAESITVAGDYSWLGNVNLIVLEQ